MATLRNKTTSDGIIVLWKPYPDHGRPSTYQVTRKAVEFLAELGFEVPNPGDEAEIPWGICRPLRVLNDLYFKSNELGDVEIEDIGDTDADFAQSLTESQQRHLKEYISTHPHYDDSSSSLNNEMSSLPTTNDGSRNKSQIDRKTLEEGEIFTAKIDRVNKNGIIQAKNGHINVGPLKKEAEGKTIMAERVATNFAICVSNDVRAKDYTTKFWRVHPNLFYKFGKQTIDSAMFCRDCGSLALLEEEYWVCGTCESTFTQNDFNDTSSGVSTNPTELPEVGEVVQNVTLTTDSRDNICSSDNKKIKINGDVNLRDTVDIKIQSKRNQSVVATVIDKSTEKSSRREALEKLRKKAINAATEHVSSTSGSSNSGTKSYSRSKEVKEYVKTRANGKCESCEEPAPFTSKTGDPYLHAHHIHELSNGGSDTPDTVVALCPNCHYEIHHGKNGEELNQKILSKVQEIETNDN